MKRYYLFLIGFLLCIFACTKNNSDDTSGLSQNIQNFVPQSVIDSMRKWGLTINEGKTPPAIAGIYNFSRDYCTFDNSGVNSANTYFLDYHLRFHDQSNTNLTIALDYKSQNALDTALGVGSFIAGSDNNFTVFVNVTGSSNGVSYKAISFYTGTKTANGIQNFQLGIYIKEKGPDPSNILAKVGTTRIFKDYDGFSETIFTY